MNNQLDVYPGPPDYPAPEPEKIDPKLPDFPVPKPELPPPPDIPQPMF